MCHEGDFRSAPELLGVAQQSVLHDPVPAQHHRRRAPQPDGEDGAVPVAELGMGESGRERGLQPSPLTASCPTSQHRPRMQWSRAGRGSGTAQLEDWGHRVGPANGAESQREVLGVLKNVGILAPLAEQEREKGGKVVTCVTPFGLAWDVGAAGSCELLSYLLVALVERQDVFLPKVTHDGPRGWSRRQLAAPPVAAPHQEAKDGEEEEEDGQQHPGHPSLHPQPVPPSKEKIRKLPPRGKSGVSSEEPLPPAPFPAPYIGTAPPVSPGLSPGSVTRKRCFPPAS